MLKIDVSSADDSSDSEQFDKFGVCSVKLIGTLFAIGTCVRRAHPSNGCETAKHTPCTGGYRYTLVESKKGLISGNQNKDLLGVPIGIPCEIEIRTY